MARASDSFFLLSLFRDQTFQMRQIRRVMVLAGIFVLVSTALLGLFYHYILGELVAGTGPMLFAADDIQRINQQMPNLSSVLGRWLIVMLVINVVITALVAVYITRKLGSPLLAIRRALREIGEGNLNVRLRASDSNEFSEVSDALNVALEQVQSRIKAAQTEAAISDLQDQPPPDAEQIRLALQNCQRELAYFETAADDAARRA